MQENTSAVGEGAGGRGQGGGTIARRLDEAAQLSRYLTASSLKARQTSSHPKLTHRTSLILDAGFGTYAFLDLVEPASFNNSLLPAVRGCLTTARKESIAACWTVRVTAVDGSTYGTVSQPRLVARRRRGLEIQLSNGNLTPRVEAPSTTLQSPMAAHPLPPPAAATPALPVSGRASAVSPLRPLSHRTTPSP